MTHDDLCAAIASTGLPWTAERFEGTPPSLPYVIIRRADADDAHADNVTIASVDVFDVELYSHNYDYAAEKLIAARLTAHGIAFARSASGEIPDSGGVCQLVFRVSTMG